MSSRWETHRGDEWWYTDYWCKLDAGFNSAYPGTLSIDGLDFKSGQITEERIQSLLWVTWQQFKENKIEILKEKELSHVIESLQAKGMVEANANESSNSRYIQIINVIEPVSRDDHKNNTKGRKAWWKFW